MKLKLLCVCSLFVFTAAATLAQGKATTSGTCAKPANPQSVEAGDAQGHVYVVQSGACTPKSEVHGAKATEGAYAEHGDMTATHGKAWGIYTETFDSGDKLFYSYTTTATLKDGAITTGSNTYKIVGGTGKMKSVRGSGSCKLKGNADGGLTYTCTGESGTAGAAAKTEKKSE